MTLAREYYDTYGPDILSAAENLCPGLSCRLSAGLAGEGSQCFEFDDEISQDHDFAPGFCVWMNDTDFTAYGSALQAVYDSLPSEFDGFTRQNLIAADRLGIMNVSEFYGRFTGIPETEEDWLLIPETNLAAAVNGEIWHSACAEFEEIRRKLQSFYPEPVLRKKLAARAAVMSQAGQYNLLRMLQRDDRVAAQLSAARFTEAAISMVHLLNRKYTPFYKWAYRSLTQLAENSPLAALTARELAKLPEVCVLPDGGEAEKAKENAFEITETICRAVAEELNRQGFSQTESSFLQDHLTDIMEGIRNPQIRSMHPMADSAF